MTDFGLAKTLLPNEKAKDKVGSLNYMPPEILLKKPHDQKVDVWSACVVIYAMLSGSQPFFGNRKRKIKKNIISKSVCFQEDIW